MTLPRAVLLIRFQSLSNLPNLSAADRPYVIAKVGSFVLGRSRPIPLSATSFDLTVEPSLWEHEVADDGSGVPIAVELWNDRGDQGPELLGVARTIIRPNSPARHHFGRSPLVTCQVSASVLPQGSARTASVQRVPSGGSGQAHVVPAPEATVEFVTIEGLYKPGVQTPGVAHRRGSGYEPGYTSQDHLGRIFVNRDLNGRWTRQRQSIRLTVNVHALRSRLPSDAKVMWEIAVPDSPLNDDPNTHRGAGPILDTGDYDANGTPLGFDCNDNEGRVHVPSSARSTAPWEAVSGFSLSDTSATVAATTIDNGRSSVILHCPDTNGDRLVVRANVYGPGVHSYPARTGTMTMWRRIDVEYIRMRSAAELPVEEIPQYFEPACIQLDFVTMPAVADREWMTPNYQSRRRRCGQYIRRVAQHYPSPGWFCLVSALRCYRRIAPPTRRFATTGTITQIYMNDILTVVGVYEDVVGVRLSFGMAPNRRSVRFSNEAVHWLNIDSTTGSRTVIRRASRASQATHTVIPIRAQEINPNFEHNNGSLATAEANVLFYSPQREGNNADWFPNGQGFGVPNNVDVELLIGQLPFEPVANTPPIRIGRQNYFAGQSMLHNAARQTRDYIITTIVHELTHAFGMPHICGQHDYRTPRQHACAMSYEHFGLIDADNRIVADNAENTGPRLCALHIRELRRTKLEINRALRWR